LASWAPGAFSDGGSRDTRRPTATRASGFARFGRAPRPLSLASSTPYETELAEDRLGGRLSGATSGGDTPGRRSSASTEQSRAFDGVRVLIVDDHLLFAEALRSLLSVEPWIEVVGHARNGREAVELAASLEPDLILIDLDMPVMGGVEAIKKIRQRSDVAIVVISGSEIPHAAAWASAAGASGFLPKYAAPADLLAWPTRVLSAKS
jgi:CheY-like chemotaxis protein